MIISCPNCDARLQLEDGKVPGVPFTVRCMKCQLIINAEPPARPKNGSALAAAGAIPPSSGSVSEILPSAPAGALVSQIPSTSLVSAPPASSVDENNVLRLLAALLQQGGATGENGDGLSPHRAGRPQRRVLVCVSAGRADAVERTLDVSRYEIAIAANTTDAIGGLRAGKTSVVILDSEFDPVEQGTVFVNREISMMRPSERRRLFFVQLSPSARTADAHAAFINNVNLIVNFCDMKDLPHLLEQGIADVNDLYRDFNNVLNLAAL